MKVWNLSKGGGGVQPQIQTFFGINFGSIEIQIWVGSRAIDTYFWIQTLGGKIHTFILFNEDLPKVLPYAGIFSQ